MRQFLANAAAAWSTRFTIDSNCSKAEALRRLQADPGREGWVSPKPGLAGRFNPDALWLWLAPRGRSTFQVFFRGRIVDLPAGGSRLEGEFLVGRPGLVILGIVLAAVLLTLEAVVQALVVAALAGEPVGPHIGPVVATAAFAALVLIPLPYSLRTHGRTREELKAVLVRVLAEAPAGSG